MDSMLKVVAALALSLAGTRPASAETLADRVQSADGWVSYRVPMAPDAGVPCCFDRREGKPAGRGCDLDGRDWNVSADAAPPAAAHDDLLAVYLHVEHGRVDRLRAFAASCPARSAGAVRQLDGVEAAQSVAFLAQGVEQAPREHDADERLAALAFHAAPEATSALRGLSAPGHEVKLREGALFWLGQARGAGGADLVEHVATTDADAELRAHAVFVLSQSHGPDPYLRVRAIAGSDVAPLVRAQALFWMAQLHDARAAADIQAALRREASQEVREQAVFALSQLAGDDADRALIEVLRGDYPRAVKERAMFWLGQSGSKAALAFLDQSLGAAR